MAKEAERHVTIRGYRPADEAAVRRICFETALYGRPFTRMPKIHVRLGVTGYRVLDQSRKLPAASVTVRRDARRITLRIPLALLGDPDRILTAARTYVGDIPLDWAAWRVIEMPRTAERVADRPQVGPAPAGAPAPAGEPPRPAQELPSGSLR